MKFRMFLVCVLAMCIVGCDSFKGNDLAVVETEFGNMSKVLDQQQKVIADMVVEMRKSELISESTVAKVTSINKQIDEIQPKVENALIAVRDVNSTGDDFVDLVAKLQAANRTTVGYNPYAPVIEGGLALTTLVAGLFGWNKRKEAQVAGAKYAAHKQGVESLTKRITADGNGGAKIAADLYDAIGKARVNLGVK